MEQRETLAANQSFASDILAFLHQNKKWWLYPVVAMIALVGLLIALSATGLAPFIYPIF